LLRQTKNIVLLLLLSSFLASAVQAAEARPVSITGRLSVIWRDPQPPAKTAPAPLYLLTGDDGQITRLELDEKSIRAAGGPSKLDRQLVTVSGARIREARGAAMRVQSLQFAAIPERLAVGTNTAVTGAQPWISVLCKFGDVFNEPQSLGYFQNMYASYFPGLDHYFRELSYNNITVSGSGAAGWFTLPYPRSYYVYDFNGDGQTDFDTTKAAQDCTAVADPWVNYSYYAGINLMFNETIGCCAYGTAAFPFVLDSVSRSWRLTWEPPWGYGNLGVMGHEMGHGFGLPHSAGQYGVTYDNQWDVMSDIWSNCERLNDPTYGCLGQHFNSSYKDDLGWIAPTEKYTLTGGQVTIALEQLALPQTSAYRMARIPIPGSGRSYTVEARRQVGYDYKLPGEGVIIHEIDPARPIPAQLIDIDYNGFTGDAGAIWTPGETFTDSYYQISVTVNYATATGYVVTLSVPHQTTTTITSSNNPSQVGEAVTFTATVTSGASGSVTFRDNGSVLATVPLSGNTASFTTSSLTAGVHGITAEYSGNGTYGASYSQTLTQNVQQATVTTLTTSQNPAPYGVAVYLTATVSGGATGLVTFFDGADAIASYYLVNGSVTFEIWWLYQGTHSIAAVYEGDQSHEPSRSGVLQQVIHPQPGAPTGLAATAISPTQVWLTWNAVSGASYYQIVYYSNGQFSWAASPVTNSYLHGGLAPDTTYYYQVVAVFSDNSSGPWSVIEPATTVLYANDPLSSGWMPISAGHLTQLRTAVNAMRSSAGLPAVSFTDPVITPGVTRVKEVHLRELRSALDAARAAKYLPPVWYSNAMVSAGESIRAADFQELREGTK
jgi:hypothetical protein